MSTKKRATRSLTQKDIAKGLSNFSKLRNKSLQEEEACEQEDTMVDETEEDDIDTNALSTQ